MTPQKSAVSAAVSAVSTYSYRGQVGTASWSVEASGVRVGPSEEDWMMGGWSLKIRSADDDDDDDGRVSCNSAAGIDDLGMEI